MTPSSHLPSSPISPQQSPLSGRTRPARPRRPARPSDTIVNQSLARRPDELSKSVGAIVLNKRLQTLLVFQDQNKYWEFPKGKMEAGEREMDTLRRELFEETGIRQFQVMKQFRKVVYYDFQFEDRLIRRQVVYFLIRTNDRVRISDEHTEYSWLPLPRARKRLKHANQVQLIDQVIHRLYGTRPRTD